MVVRGSVRGAVCQALGAEEVLRQGGKWRSHWEDASPWNYANWAPTYPHRLFTTCTTLSARGEGTRTPHPLCQGTWALGGEHSAIGGNGKGVLGGGTGHWWQWKGAVGGGHRTTGGTGKGTGRAQAIGGNGRGHRTAGGSGKGTGLLRAQATGDSGRGQWEGGTALWVATGGGAEREYRALGRTGCHPMALMLAPVPRWALEKQALLPAAPLHLPVLKAPRGAAMAPPGTGYPRWPLSLTQ